MSDTVHTFLLCLVFFVNQMCDHSLFSASTSVTIPPPQGPPLWNIYVIMSSEPANKVMEIPVAEVVQETDLEYSVDEVVEAQYPEDFEADIFQLGRYSVQSEELPGKAVVKDNR